MKTKFLIFGLIKLLAISNFWNDSIFLVQADCAFFQPFSFGVIADCQCGSMDCNSVPKLEEAVNYFNTTDISFCAHLGDFIMNGYENYALVQPIYESLHADHYYVLGNHEWDIPDAEKAGLKDKLGMPDYYYDFKLHNFRFIFIESSELAFFNEAAHPQLVAERDSIYAIYGGSQGCGGISQKQLAYINTTIAIANQNNENVVLFAHHPIYPPTSNRNVWNDTELIDVLEQYDNVVAYMNGHNHVGDYNIKNGIHYVTFKAMLSHTNSYSKIEVVQDTLKIYGQGEADNYTLTFPARVIIQDEDEDGVCDDEDICSSFDDTLIGLACNDNDVCTINDVYGNDCLCAGVFMDTDGDSVCDAEDVCSGFDDILIGMTCNDNDVCTINDVYGNDCLCAGVFTDTDGDGVCDANDICPGFNDLADSDQDGTPNECDNCLDFLIAQNNTSIDNGIYNVADYIISDGIVNYFGSVQYYAGSYIELKIGFETRLFADFDAVIDGCLN